MYCLLSSPAHKSCASGSHCRGVRRMFILWVVSQVSQGVCMRPAPWQQRDSKDLECRDIWPAQLYCSAGPWLLPSPRGTRDTAQVVLCCTGALQGCSWMARPQCEQVKPNRSSLPRRHIWFACRRQDFRTCIRHEGRVIFI